MPKKTVVPVPSQTKTALLSRLRTIEGHVRGILRMVEAALIAGVLILLMPRLLNLVVAIYLIVIGLVGVLGR